MKNLIRKILKEELDRMSKIDLNSYFIKNKNNKEWVGILNRFPEMLQREIIDERPKGDEEDIKELKDWVLKNNKPIEVNIKDILKYNLDILDTIPQDAVDVINKKWGTNVKTKHVYDANPGRYLEYSKMNPETAKPSVMVNGHIYWGSGRFVAALIRGDKTLKAWDVRKK